MKEVNGRRPKGRRRMSGNYKGKVDDGGCKE